MICCKILLSLSLCMWLEHALYKHKIYKYIYGSIHCTFYIGNEPSGYVKGLFKVYVCGCIDLLPSLLAFFIRLAS